MERSRPMVGRLRRPVAAIAALTIGLSLALSVPPVAQAEPKKTPAVVKTDVREVKPGQQFSTKKLDLKASARSKAKVVAATPAVGTTRTLLALDDYQGFYYLKSYTLQAVGAKVEVWVADDTSFPADDCRNQVADSTTVTRAQAQELADQFDSNMVPKESQAFSVAPDRDGSKADPRRPDTVDPTGDGD